MADFTQLITNLRADVDAADSDTSMRDILALLHRGSKITTFHKWYDSASALPIDSAYGGYIAFTKSDNALRVFNDSDMRWAALDSALETSSGGGATFARQGTNYAYISGGTPPVTNAIEKHPFASDANTTDVGDLIYSMYGASGASYTTHGYTHGGYYPGGWPGNDIINNIQKFPTSTDGNATDVADLLANYRQAGGTQSATHGYVAGNNPATNVIQKHEFATDGDATDVGDLLTPQSKNTSTSASETHGSTAGGHNPSQPDGDFADTIQKWPFSADANSTDVGDLSVESYKAYNSGTTGETHGYSHGGQGGLPSSFAHSVTIEKYSFSADGNSTDVGDLTVASTTGTGASSTTNGYGHGGNPPLTNVIQKYPFSADANATDVGDISSTRSYMAGTQY